MLSKYGAIGMSETFKKVSARKKVIYMEDIRILLDQNGVACKQHHIDAILRRCDHDADMKIDLDEFLESAGRSLTEIEDEKKTIEAKVEQDRISRINRSIESA